MALPAFTQTMLHFSQCSQDGDKNPLTTDEVKKLLNAFFDLHAETLNQATLPDREALLKGPEATPVVGAALDDAVFDLLIQIVYGLAKRFQERSRQAPLAPETQAPMETESPKVDIEEEDSEKKVSIKSVPATQDHEEEEEEDGKEGKKKAGIKLDFVADFAESFCEDAKPPAPVKKEQSPTFAKPSDVHDKYPELNLKCIKSETSEAGTRDGQSCGVLGNGLKAPVGLPPPMPSMEEESPSILVGSKRVRRRPKRKSDEENVTVDDDTDEDDFQDDVSFRTVDKTKKASAANQLRVNSKKPGACMLRAFQFFELTGFLTAAVQSPG